MRYLSSVENKVFTSYVLRSAGTDGFEVRLRYVFMVKGGWKFHDAARGSRRHEN